MLSSKMMIFAECPLYVRSTYESLQRDSCTDHLCPVQPREKTKAQVQSGSIILTPCVMLFSGQRKLI